ncbi:hypothetical protein CJ030_MR3G027873 [Morella rubra]|uniref:Uncharacterized protein n=1 Tax=Morella rubra TaxID=262757 RepID=A0A6A1W676_9ROSI|nr:hypothetical protein CJ030_MR3G027873 [Morella rubra]
MVNITLRRIKLVRELIELRFSLLRVCPPMQVLYPCSWLKRSVPNVPLPWECRYDAIIQFIIPVSENSSAKLDVDGWTHKGNEKLFQIE